ncbi:MAG: TonB-dependent receptor [Porphyromonas sp.]|nr:TonB-dependent receptor [Porphyromonas sp.]
MERRNQFFLRFISLLSAIFIGVGPLFAADTIVKGQVKDENGEPIIGAIVKYRAGGEGAATNIDGEFNISAPDGAELEISYIGYTTAKVVWSGQNPFVITLIQDQGLLEELVVVGYGTQAKVNLSGAVDQLSTKTLEQRPMSNISQGLQGMIPNLNIDFTSGEPGKAAKINVRGMTSINGGEPLLLIDGVSASADELNRLLPEDIASISVLKDAASAAIYGARAAFGVILVTTKSGKRVEGIQVGYNNHLMWKRPSILPAKSGDPYIYLKTKNIAVLNTPWSGGHVASDERLEWARQKSDNPEGTPSVRLNPLDETQWEYMGGQDWTAHFLNKATFSQAHQLSISGSSEKSSYYLSGGFNQEDGLLAHLVEKDNYLSYAMRAKGSYKVTDRLTVSNNTTYSSTQREKPGYFWNADMSLFYNLAPSDYDVNPDGTWANSGVGRLMARLQDGGNDLYKQDRFQTTFGAELSLFNDLLKVNANYSYRKGFNDYNYSKTKYKIGYGPDDVREEGESMAYRTYATDVYQVLDLFGTFNWTTDKHNVVAILGFNQENNVYNWVKAEREGLISSSFPTISLATGLPNVDENYSSWAIRGLFYRLNYIYEGRYIVELNGRYDGSSRFPKENRFGFFPSFSLAWRVDSEPFFEPLTSVVSQFKLRASYGSLGNQQVSAFGYIPSMSPGTSGYLIDGVRPQIIGAPGLVSPNYTWEQVNTKNLGVDLGFLSNRLNLTFDIYRRDTQGMLVPGKELPGVLGAASPKENAADLKTNGWELSVSYTDHLTVMDSPLELGARFTLSDTRSWITRFDNPNRLLTQYYVGQELGEIWGLQSDGLFKDKEEIAALDESEIIPWGALSIVPGWPKYKDLDGDGRITKGMTVDDPKDLSVIGNASPRFRYGFTFTAGWKGIDFSLFLQGIGKRDYYPLHFLYWSFYQQPYAGGQTHIYDYYRPVADSEVERAKHSQAYIDAGLADQNLDSQYPVLQSWLADRNLGTTIDKAMGMAIPQTGHLLSGAYLRVKNITLGYTLPEQWTEKININRLRLFVSADNLYEWSGVRNYFDPEAITESSDNGYTYPFNRQYIVGLNLTF